MTYLETVYADNLDKTKSKATEVRLCNVVNLPFRLRIGNSYIFPKSNNEDFKLYFRNPYEIPAEGIKIIELKNKSSKCGTNKFFNTKVLIMLKRSLDEHIALKVLNDFIVAYGTVTTTPISIFGEDVRTLKDMEFSEACEWKIIYHCPKGYILTDSDVDNLINKKPSFSGNCVIIPNLKIKDLSPETLEKIQSTFDFHKKFMFYEFAFYARVRIESEDYIGALLMACIALEGVHGAYVRISKDKRKCNRNLNNKSKKNRSVPGFYKRLEKATSEYMDSKEKPPDDLMTKCETAIKIRDDIMHAISTDGVYEFRKYQRSDFVEAYQTILQVYEYFRKVLENRMG